VVDDSDNGLCNNESSTGARTNGVSAMVTAALEPHRRVANADKETTEKPVINHADAPQGMSRRFGTDLAQWVPRENCA